jgi:type II secretory pathway component PulK
MNRLRTGLSLWMMRASQRLRRKVGDSRRGMALIVVFTTVAILSTSITEYVYNTRVNLRLAQNQRDEVKAYYLARSGVNLQRLAIAYQSQLASQPGLVGRAVTRSNFQLWQYLDLLLPTFSSGSLSAQDLGELDLGETGASGFQPITGSIEFQRPEPEEGKTNINAFAGQQLDQAVLQELCSLLRPPQYDELLGSAADRAVESRYEIIAAIIDHVDPDSDVTTIDENCIVRPGGAGNEGSRYDEVDWEPKNEPLVTLDELRQVPGVTGAFMRQFAENLTVYPVAGAFYVNLADAQQFAGFMCGNIVGANESYTPCVDPRVAAQVNFLSLALEGWVKFFENPFNVLSLWLGGGAGGVDLSQAVSNGQMMAFRRDRDFFSVLNSFMQNPQLALYFMAFADPQRAMMFGYAVQSGIPLLPPQFGIVFDETRMRARVSVDVPQIFTLRATGVYGGASRTITAVADFNNQGRLIYWREY